MNYVSTRNNQINFSSEQVLNYGLAPDGGLFIPSELPKFSSEDLNNFKNADYKEIAYFVLKIVHFVTKNGNDGGPVWYRLLNQQEKDEALVDLNIVTWSKYSNMMRRTPRRSPT